MSIKETGEHKFKFVKKANMWCETWFELNEMSKQYQQKQQWLTEEEYKEATS
jgi:hypothetical protein